MGDELIVTGLLDVSDIPLHVLLDPPPDLREALEVATARILADLDQPYEGCC